MLNLEKANPEKCFAMAGLHPCSVSANFSQELDQTQIFSKKIFFPAVGEIGLDFYWSTEFIKEQYEAFGFQMEWALQNKLPAVIHTCNATRGKPRLCQIFFRKKFNRNISLF